MRNKTTIKDIAKNAGVCHKTVSNYLNKTANVKKETAERIKNAIVELNYIPNLHARGLRTGKTKVIAYIESFLNNPSTINVVKGVQEELYKEGYFLNIISIDKNVPVDEIAQLYNIFVFDGIILGAVSRELVMFLNNLQLPFITLAQYKNIPENIFKLRLDHFIAGEIVAEYLIDNNHKRFGFFINKGEVEINDFEYLERGFSDRLNKGNFKINFKYLAPLGIEEIEKVLEKDKHHIKDSIIKNKISAIFTTDDNIAIILINILRDFKINVPGDVSVIGFGDIRISKVIRPKLTTIDRLYDKRARMVAKIIISLIEGKNSYQNDIVLKPELVIRDSVRKI